MEESLFFKGTLSIDDLVTSSTGALCSLCNRDIMHGQTTSSVRLIKDNEEIHGHYACVIAKLGPEATLAAIQEGILPALNVKAMVDHRVPGWEKLSGF